MSDIVVDHVYKVFGKHPRRGVELAEQGLSQDEIHGEHGQVVAVRDATFEVAEGELFVVMGLSGSGKSTLLRTINRLFEPTAGTVSIDGANVTAMSDEELRRLRMHRVSMVFQHFALFPHRLVWENAAYGLEVREVPRQERKAKAEEALERVNLAGWGDRYPGDLSGGMQQRVGLARALATDADILLMDEPFGALDPLIKRDMQDLLLELQRELQRTIVFITHDLNEAMRLGDRIAVMRDGQIVQLGTSAEIIAEPANAYVEDFVADVDRSRVLTAEMVMRDPIATASPSDDPRNVLKRLEDLEANGMYVLDGDRRVLGIVRDDDLARAVKRGADRIEDDLVQEWTIARPDTPLINLSSIAARDTVPVAVTDDDHHLLGVVPRPTLLSALAGEGTTRG